MDIIHIKKLEVFANHGVHPEENTLGQKFVISADLFLDIREAGTTDDLTKSVHYGQAACLIKEVCEKATFKLIERLAEEIAKALLLKFPIEKVSVVVEKPWAPVKLPLETVAVEVVRGWHRTFLSIGSNMGDRKAHLMSAIEKLDAMDECRVIRCSEFIETKPYGGVEQDDFLNAALDVRTLLTPHELLATLHAIEAEEGRERLIHWGPRTLDLDIELYDDIKMFDPDLVIPHPDMHNREFVLSPLCELAPYVTHPVFGKTIWVLYEELKEKTNSEFRKTVDN